MQGIVEKMKAQTEIMTKLTEKISATTLKEILQHTQKLYTVLRSIDKQYYGSSRSSPENDNTYTINPSEQEATLQQACQKLPALIEKLKVQKQLWWKTILRKLKN
jgi:predicted RNA-binding protein